MDVVDDSSSRLNYVGSWSTDHITGALDGTVHTTSDPNAYVSLEFTGTYIELDALKSINGANFTIKLDGTSYGTYSLYSTTTNVTNVWAQRNLIPTVTHTIEVHRAVETGTTGSAVEINVDAFQISTSSAGVGSPDGITKTSTSTSSSSASTTRSTSTSSSQETSFVAVSSPSTSTSSTPPFIPIPIPVASPSPSPLAVPAPSPDPSPDGSDDSVPSPSPDGSVNSEPSPSPSPDSPPSDETSPAPSPDPTSDDADDSDTFQPAPAPSSTSTRSNSTTTHSSTSNSTTHHTSTIPITRTSTTLLSHTTSSSAIASPDTSSSSGSQKTGVVLGSVVAVIIGVCLLTIPIVWFKRRRAKSESEFLRASTTPAYQTTTVTRGLAPPILSSFGRSSGHSGSNTHVGAYQPSPIARTADTHSPFSDEYAQPMTAEGQYYIFPATPPPASHPRQRYTESADSDYPYPLAYNSRDPHNRDRDPSPYSGSS